MKDFVVRGSGDNIVLERLDGISARPASPEELFLYQFVQEQRSAILRQEEKISELRRYLLLSLDGTPETTQSIANYLAQTAVT